MGAETVEYYVHPTPIEGLSGLRSAYAEFSRVVSKPQSDVTECYFCISEAKNINGIVKIRINNKTHKIESFTLNVLRNSIPDVPFEEDFPFEPAHEPEAEFFDEFDDETLAKIADQKPSTIYRLRNVLFRKYKLAPREIDLSNPKEELLKASEVWKDNEKFRQKFLDELETEHINNLARISVNLSEEEQLAEKDRFEKEYHRIKKALQSIVFIANQGVFVVNLVEGKIDYYYNEKASIPQASPAIELMGIIKKVYGTEINLIAEHKLKKDNPYYPEYLKLIKERHSKPVAHKSVPVTQPRVSQPKSEKTNKSTASRAVSIGVGILVGAGLAVAIGFTAPVSISIAALIVFGLIFASLISLATLKIAGAYEKYKAKKAAEARPVEVANEHSDRTVKGSTHNRVAGQLKGSSSEEKLSPDDTKSSESSSSATPTNSPKETRKNTDAENVRKLGLRNEAGTSGADLNNNNNEVQYSGNSKKLDKNT